MYPIGLVQLPAQCRRRAGHQHGPPPAAPCTQVRSSPLLHSSARSPSIQLMCSAAPLAMLDYAAIRRDLASLTDRFFIYCPALSLPVLSLSLLAAHHLTQQQLRRASAGAALAADAHPAWAPARQCHAVLLHKRPAGPRAAQRICPAMPCPTLPCPALCLSLHPTLSCYALPDPALPRPLPFPAPYPAMLCHCLHHLFSLLFQHCLRLARLTPQTSSMTLALSPSELVREQFSHLCNAIASLPAGRSYLMQVRKDYMRSLFFVRRLS